MNEEKRQRLIDELNGLRSGDREGDHIAADDILVEALDLAGYQESPTHGYRHANALDSGTPERRRNGSH